MLFPEPVIAQLSNSQDFARSLRSHSNAWGIVKIQDVDSQPDPLTGPYMAIGEGLWHLVRLYDNT